MKNGIFCLLIIYRSALGAVSGTAQYTFIQCNKKLSLETPIVYSYFSPIISSKTKKVIAYAACNGWVANAGLGDFVWPGSHVFFLVVTFFCCYRSYCYRSLSLNDTIGLSKERNSYLGRLC